jgi:hypothetical protein
MQFAAMRKKLARIVLPRRMSTADFRRIQREIANDPEVDRAVREALERYPQYRRGSQGRDV